MILIRDRVHASYTAIQTSSVMPGHGLGKQTQAWLKVGERSGKGRMMRILQPRDRPYMPPPVLSLVLFVFAKTPANLTIDCHQAPGTSFVPCTFLPCLLPSFSFLPSFLPSEWRDQDRRWTRTKLTKKNNNKNTYTKWQQRRRNRSGFNNRKFPISVGIEPTPIRKHQTWTPLAMPTFLIS
jgi:hypothetical protein